MTDKTMDARDVGGFHPFRGALPLVILTLACLAVGIWAYPRLPDRVPSHWNWRGEVDGWSSRTFGVFFLPVLCLAMIGLFGWLPNADPFKRNYERFAGAYGLIRAIIVLFFMALYLLTLFAGLGYIVNVSFAIRLWLSLMMIVLGDQIGRVKRNWFVGIRVPWTMASDENWRRTHRWGAKSMVLCGVLSLLTLPFGTPAAATIHFALVMAGALAPVAYSYILFRQGAK